MVFHVKFCEAQSPNEGMPPVKVLPRDCPAAEKEGRPCSCGYIMYIGYNFQEQYPTRWDKVLRGAVEIMSPVYAAPAGGYKASRKKVIPGVPPCLEPRGADKNKWTRDKVAAVHTLSQGPSHSGKSRSSKAARGRSAKLAEADQKLTLQQQEIDALERQVEALSEAKAVARRSRRQQSLAQLRARAARLMQQVREREQMKQEDEKHPAARADQTERTVGMLAKTVSHLGKDVSKIDSKLESISKTVSKAVSDKNSAAVFGEE